ncbi:T9SS type A sorting domain-containing protein [Calditrichota bacterium]
MFENYRVTTVCSILVALIFALNICPSVYAQWQENGNLIYPSEGIDFGAAEMNEDGEVLMGWVAQHRGYQKPHFRLFAANGAPVWDEDLVIEHKDVRANRMTILPIGEDWLALWEVISDWHQDGANIWTYKIVAQMISSEGILLWNNGESLILTPAEERVSFYVAEGTEDDIFLLYNFRARDDEYYSLKYVRFFTDGTLDEENFPEGGVEPFEENITYPPKSFVPDDEGGAYVACELNDTTLAVQRVLSSGEIAWEEALVLTHSFRSDFEFCSDGMGGLFVSWKDRNDGPFLVHLNSDGQQVWEEPYDLDVSEYSMVPAGEGQFWQIREVNRYPNSDDGLHAQLISSSPDGPEFHFDGAGIHIIDPDHGGVEYVTNVTEAGDLLIAGAFEDYEEGVGYVIIDFVQRVTIDGEKFWQNELDELFINPNEAIFANEDLTWLFASEWLDELEQSIRYQLITNNGEVALDDEDAILFGWHDYPTSTYFTPGAEGNLFILRVPRENVVPVLQSVDRDSNLEFDGDGVNLFNSTYKRVDKSKFCADGEGGIIAVHQFRDDDQSIILAQRFLDDELLWNIGGTALEPENLELKRISPNGEGGAYVLTRQEDEEEVRRYLLFNIDAAGRFVWGNGGIELPYSSMGILEMELSLVSNELLLVWRESFGRDSSRLRAQLLDWDGEFLFEEEGVVITSTEDVSMYFAIGIAQDGFYIVYENSERIDGDFHDEIWVQHINLDGERSWEGNEVLLDSSEGEYNLIVGGEGCVVDDDNNLLVVWRGAESEHGGYLYAQKISPVGELLTDYRPGRALGESNSGTARTVPDGDDGLYASWHQGNDDPMNESDINLVHLDSDLQVVNSARWGQRGAPVCNARFGQSVMGFCPDGRGGVFVAWSDSRAWRSGGSNSIYLTNINDNSEFVSEERNSLLPLQLELMQAYPNPFNSSTRISYTVPTAGVVTLKLFDISGREVAVLESGLRSAGDHLFTLDAQNLATGVYMLQLNSSAGVQTQKIVSLK